MRRNGFSFFICILEFGFEYLEEDLRGISMEKLLEICGIFEETDLEFFC